MPSYTQENRPLAINTPLGKDVLFLNAFRGSEAISELFSFQLDLLAQVETPIRFDSILGQNVTVELRLPNEKKRFLNGIIKSFSQGSRDDLFVHFRAEMVPQLWLLTKRVRCRIFQHLPIPDILHKVFSGLDVTYEVSGTYLPRDYCVQYRESDFDFASRLMEEEGIYYFFRHGDGTHKMIVSDAITRHPAVPGEEKVLYDEVAGTVGEGSLVRSWEKTQELRSGAYTLWDHCFEMPGKNLEAKERTVESVAAGKVTHKLHVGGNDQLEIYDYPGGYAKRFDGVDHGGAAQPQSLKNVIKDGERTVRIRMEQEEVEGLRIEGASGCGQFTAGHKFALGHHFDGDGEYLLTRVQHNARLGEGSYRSASGASDFQYENRFTCIPTALSYRPQRRTRKPVIAGAQTATVVGPPGEEIFCDKYGRVKVQFHWDREGKHNASSSCWLRVAQVWAGKGWGAFFWPRNGHEVVVTFEDGDPDRPLIVGSVYNAENMPWFALPINKQLSGFKSESVGGKAYKNFNGIVFNDRTGKEHLAIHSERNLSLNSKGDKMIHGGSHKGERVGVAHVLTVGKLLPGGGSGGGGDFNEGNPLPAPPPTGIMGLNSVVTFGDNFQLAGPLNHQVTLGNNLQLCINPMGLLAGMEGGSAVTQAIFGGALGGNMQFTVGASAQFTLGQSFEISVGPPKIEIHSGYDGHMAVQVLCGVLSAATIAFVLAYDLSAATQTYHPPSQNSTDAQVTAEQSVEQPGDKLRAEMVVIFQLLVSVLLSVIMGVEAILDQTDWFVHDTMKQIFSTAAPFKIWTPPAEKPVPTNWADIGFGGAAGLAIVAAEVAGPLAEL